MIHGRNIVIYDGQNHEIIAAAKSCTIRTQSQMVEVTPSSNTGTGSEYARQYIKGRYSWSIQISFLMMALASTVTKPLTNGSNVYVKILNRETPVGTTDGVAGYAYVEEAEVVGTWGNLATGSWKLRGTGPLSSL